MAITLPASLALKRNTAAERKLTDAARGWVDKDARAEGIHASDLLDIRQAYWRHTDPRPTGDRLVPVFLVGKVLHSFVLGAMEGVVDLDKSDEGSAWSEELGIHYSLDWDKSDIAEFKTSRAFKDPETVEDLGIYIEQTLIYMAAKGRTTAQLWVLLLNLRDEQRRTAPAFRAYTISISPDDLLSLKTTISEQVTLLNSVLASKEYRTLPLCRTFKCGEGNCDWWSNCQPAGRYGLEKREWTA